MGHKSRVPHLSFWAGHEERPHSQEDEGSSAERHAQPPRAGSLGSGSGLGGPFRPSFKAVLKRAAAKKSRNDLIHAEEGQDRLADLCAAGEPPPAPLALRACGHTDCAPSFLPVTQAAQLSGTPSPPSPLPTLPKPASQAHCAAGSPAFSGWCSDLWLGPQLCGAHSWPWLARFSMARWLLWALPSPWTGIPPSQPTAGAVCVTNSAGTRCSWPSVCLLCPR